MTNSECLALARKPGKIYMPVLAGNDVIHIEIVKADLIFHLKDWPKDEICYWQVIDTSNDTITLDTN